MILVGPIALGTFYQSTRCTMNDPHAIAALELLIEQQLVACTPEQRETFRKLSVPVHAAALRRNGLMDSVYVVAQRGSEVMYYEDHAKGFNFSFTDSAGTILHHWVDPHDLSQAMPHWMGFAKRTHRSPS